MGPVPSRESVCTSARSMSGFRAQGLLFGVFEGVIDRAPLKGF